MSFSRKVVMLPLFSSKSKLSLLFKFYSLNLFQLQLQYWVSCLDFILTKIKYFVRIRLHINKPNEIGYFWMQQLRDHIWMQQLRLWSIRKTATTKVNFVIPTMVYWALKMFLFSFCDLVSFRNGFQIQCSLFAYSSVKSLLSVEENSVGNF